MAITLGFWNTGISSFTVTRETQEVLVKTAIPYEDILEKIKKTGKEVRKQITAHIHLESLTPRHSEFEKRVIDFEYLAFPRSDLER
jgi:hypothetical protein